MPAITLLQPFNLDATKDYTFGNVTANIKTDSLMYANGTPYVLGGTVSGSNTQIQFNNAGSFGSSANLTFDNTTNTLSVTNIIANGAQLTNIAGANVTGFVPNANVANTAYAVAGANVSGQVGNALVAGTVYTNAQPNITSVGTLTSLTVTGALASGDATVTGNLTVSGTTITANVSSIVVKDPIIEQGGEVSGALTTNDGKDRGALLHYYSGGVIDAFMGWDNSNAEFAFGSNVTVSSEVVTFNTLGNLRAGVYFGNGSGLTSLAGANVTGFVPNANVANTAYSVSGSNVSGEVANATYATTSGTALSVAGANVSGTVSSATTAGTVTTNAQPNITSVGTLTGLTVNGTTTLGDASNVKISGGSVNQYLKTDGTGNLSWDSIPAGGNANVAGSNTQIQFNNGTNLGASANLTFDTTTNTLSVTNIVANGAGLTSIAGANVTGFVPNANVANTAYSVSGANVSGDVAGANVANVAAVANSVAGANVTGTVANATYAVTAGTALSVAGANVSGAVAYATTANSVAGANVSGQVSNALVAGTVYTNAQPNITSVGTLTSLDVTGNITAGNANLGNLVTANFFSGNGSSLTSIAGANVTGFVPNANVANTAYSVSGANVSGEVANATYATSAGSVAGANVSGQVANALVAGTVYTNAQPNITSVGTLSSLSVTGNVSAGNVTTTGSIAAVDATITGNLTVSGNTITANVSSIIVKDPIIEQGGDTAGALTTNDGKDRGQLLHYYSGGVVDAFMGWDNSNAEFAFGSNVTVSSEVVTFNTLGNLRAGFFLGNGSQLTGVTATVAQTVSNAAQPNITSVGTLSSLTVSGNLTAGNVSAFYLAGSLTTNAQPNITSIGTLTSLDVTGTITAGNIYANLGTIGANTLTGVLSTASQPNITTLGSLTGLTVTGNTSFNGANVSLGSVANLKIGGGTANYVLKTDGAGNLSWVQQPSAANITVDNFTGNGVQTTFTLSTTPSNVNSVLVNINGATQLREAYSVSGANLTFGSAPPNTAKIEITTLGLNAGGGGGGASSLATLSDVSLSSPTNNQVLQYNGSSWINSTLTPYIYSAISANTTLSAGYRYLVDTSAANLTLTLPSSPTLGQEVGILDATGSSATHAITINGNGANIMGNSSAMTVSTNSAAFTLVYYNVSRGWILTSV